MLILNGRLIGFLHETLSTEEEFHFDSECNFLIPCFRIKRTQLTGCFDGDAVALRVNQSLFKGIWNDGIVHQSGGTLVITHALLINHTVEFRSCFEMRWLYPRSRANNGFWFGFNVFTLLWTTINNTRTPCDINSWLVVNAFTTIHSPTKPTAAFPFGFPSVLPPTVDHPRVVNDMIFWSFKWWIFMKGQYCVVFIVDHFDAHFNRGDGCWVVVVVVVVA